MKAAQIQQYGHADAITITETDEPAVGDGQVLVEVHAASLNPFDTTVREGYMKDMVSLKLPVTLGGDIAGIVKQVGAGVTHVKPGDRVYGQANVVAGNSGAFAEYALTAGAQVALAPKGLQYTELAALPLVGVSAWQAVTEHLQVAAGQKLFIQGGAGGIGSVAVQLAKHLGASVAVTASGAGLDYVKQLGADVIIDHATQQFAEIVKQYDLLFDTVGGDTFTESLAVLAPGGKAVTMAAQPSEANQAAAARLGITVVHQQTKITTAALDALRELVEAGVVRVRIDSVFTLDEVAAAFEKRESGHPAGKVVLLIRAHD